MYFVDLFRLYVVDVLIAETGRHSLGDRTTTVNSTSSATLFATKAQSTPVLSFFVLSQ